MCRKSRVGKNTAKTDAKCDTQENTEKNDAKWRAEHVFGQCSAPVAAFFARKHRKYRCENKTQVQFRVSKCQNSSFSTCQPRNRTTPRGGRRTCCQQQQPQTAPATSTTAAAAREENHQAAQKTRSPLLLHCKCDHQHHLKAQMIHIEHEPLKRKPMGDTKTTKLETSGSVTPNLSHYIHYGV